MRIVVKLGGSLLTDTELLHRIVAQLGRLVREQHEVIIVHGGGKQIKHYLEQLRIPSRFHNGLRITDATTMEIVQMVLAGLVNKMIVAALLQGKISAVGLCGGDGKTFVAKKFTDQGTPEVFDYGFVGEVIEGDATLVNYLLAASYMPVIACTAIGKDFAYYNINADEMASAVAIFCGADRLIFLTDVPGVLDAEKQVIAFLNRTQIVELRGRGVIAEGMLPKTRACERALEAGLGRVHIVSGKERDCLTRVLLQNEPLGTAIQ